MTFEVYQYSFLENNQLTINFFDSNRFLNLTQFEVNKNFIVNVKNLQELMLKQFDNIPFWIEIDEVKEIIEIMQENNTTIFDLIPCNW